MPRRALLGISLGLLGVAVLAGLEPRLTAGMVVGDLLAVGAAVAFALGVFTRPVSGRALAAVLAVALVPHALGHTLYPAAVRRFHLSIVNLITTQEVTGGIVLAWLLLQETPTWNAVAGTTITLVGVALVLLERLAIGQSGN